MGMTLFRLGFRPFFLLGTAYGIVAMALWIGPYFPHALDWHAHEMIFGFAGAIIAGFLLTAVRNWTGLPTLEGTPLAGLVGLWLLARMASLGGTVPRLAAGLDLAFLVLLLGAILRPIRRVRQWRQWGVLTGVAFLAAGQAVYLAALLRLWPDGTRLGIRIGLYAVLALVLILAGRVIPFFTERGVDGPVVLRRFSWTERWALPLFCLYAALEVLTPGGTITRGLALAAAFVHAVRLWGWHTPGIWRRPLLWVLHIAYGWLVVGFLIAAFDPRTALHALTVGGMSGMILGMICRVSLGHTGRNVHQPPPIVSALFVLLFASAVVRVSIPWLDPAALVFALRLAGILWIAAFAGFLWRYAPMLWRPRIDGKPG